MERDPIASKQNARKRQARPFFWQPEGGTSREQRKIFFQKRLAKEKADKNIEK